MKLSKITLDLRKARIDLEKISQNLLKFMTYDNPENFMHVGVLSATIALLASLITQLEESPDTMLKEVKSGLN